MIEPQAVPAGSCNLAPECHDETMYKGFPARIEADGLVGFE